MSRITGIEKDIIDSGSPVNTITKSEWLLS